MKFKNLIVLGVALGLSVISHVSLARDCAQDVKDLNRVVDSLEQGATQLRVMAFNVRRPDRSSSPGYRSLKETSEVIREVSPDIAVLTEIADKESLDRLNDSFLNSEYRTFFIQGNDPVLNVAFVVRKSVPFEIEHVSHAHLKWFDPATRTEIPLFSRDLPMLIFRKSGEETPAFVFMGTHNKSKRNRDGDPQSRLWRRAQIDGAAQIAKDLKRRFGAEVPILFGGDFNTDIQESGDMNILWREFTDSFMVAKETLPLYQRITHSYIPRRGRPQYHQMDTILISKEAKINVKRADVYRFKDRNGKDKPLPRKHKDRDRNPSDHFPVVIDISIFDLLPAPVALPVAS
ncbi:MAG: hypothetical protein IT289_01785 [Oligoflexia bacterium]|nr:hypothetical protein [Oligoflexia bacterium]